MDTAYSTSWIRRIEHLCLLKTPPSLLPSGLCLRDFDRSRLILEKTLGFRSGLSDMLRERLDLSFLLRSLTSSVLDSECCTVDRLKSVLTQSALDALCEKFHILDVVHPELPGLNDRIRNSLIGKIDVYSRERVVAEGEVPLLQLTRGCVVPLAGVNNEGNVIVHGAGNDNVNEEGGDATVVDQTEQSDHVVQIGGIDIAEDDEAQAIFADKPKKVIKKRKVADGASGFGLPPKKLREDHGTFGDVGASTDGKLHCGSNSGARAAERFVVLSDSSHHSSTNAADDEVTSIVRSSMQPPPVLTTATATTIIADSTSALVLGTDVDPETFHQTYIPKWNVTNDSALDDPNVCRGVIDHLAPLALFSQLRSMDYGQLFVEFNVRAALQTCLSSEVRLRLEHELRGRKKFKDKCAMQAGWLKERDAEIANLKVQLSLKEAQAAEVILLCGNIATVEAAEVAQASELEGLKERNTALKGQDLSNLQLSCDELSIKASSLDFEKDTLVDQVSKLEGTCSELSDEVSGYKLFKEQIEAVQDVQVMVLSDRVSELDANLIGMALHLDEEFYHRYLTTITG
ncbi:hypothetical protein Tco_0985180 [Tanacetum coccineum]